MRVITFFNEKGGSGKSTLSCLFASWLYYFLGEEVRLIDFDSPSFQLSSLRSKELKMCSAAQSRLQAFVSGKPYLISRIEEGTPPQRAVTYIRGLQQEGGEGYLLLDLPGSFRREDHSRALLTSGVVDLLVIPIDTDRQTKEAAANIIMTMKIEASRRSAPSTKTLLLWNRETGQERRTMDRYDRYSVTEAQMSALGVRFLGQRMHDIQIARRDSDTFGFIRSTLCWPEENIRMRCPYLPSLFAEIKAEADGNPSDKL